jgi:hypothetical protein
MHKPLLVIWYDSLSVPGERGTVLPEFSKKAGEEAKSPNLVHRLNGYMIGGSGVSVSHAKSDWSCENLHEFLL